MPSAHLPGMTADTQARAEDRLGVPPALAAVAVLPRPDVAYDAACAAAAFHQGLDPVVGAITSTGLEVNVEQTGSMKMAATVSAPYGAGVVAVTGDRPGGDKLHTYEVRAYRHDAWHVGDPERSCVVAHDVLGVLDAVLAALDALEA